MSIGYKNVETYNSVPLTTATASLILGPIDIRGFDKFSVYFQNNLTAIAFLDMKVQVAADPSGTAANLAPNWVNLSTATLEVPSALGATSVAISSRVDNVHGFMRILGHVCQTAGLQVFRVSVSGFQRY